MLRFISFLQRLTPGPILDPPNQVLDRGRGYSNRYDSAEGVLFTHAYGIPLVSTGHWLIPNTDFGLKTRLTHTHRPDARTHPEHRSRNLKSGRLQPPKSMGSLLNARITRGAPLSATTGNTHAPDPMTGYNLHRSICVACTRTGVINLLGRTLLSEGPVAARCTARCIEQDSI